MKRDRNGGRGHVDYSVVLRVIKEGHRFRDRLILLVSVFNSLALYLAHRLGRRPMRLCYFQWRDCEVKNRSGIFRCRASTNDALIVSETHEPSLTRYFDQVTEGTFVDIGAHIGKYTVQVAKQLRGKGQVVSIEAHPGNFKTLVDNVRLNGVSNVVALNIACWRDNGQMRLYRDSASSTTAGYSVVDTFQGDSITTAARKLDDILRDIGVTTVDFMKLDVEGAEADVLRGGETLLEQHQVKGLIFEHSSLASMLQCQSILEKHGYVCEGTQLPHCILAHQRRTAR